MSKILILEDNIEIVNTLKSIFEDEGYEVDYLLSAKGVLDKIRDYQPDLITLDISFSQEKDEVGIDILEKIRKHYPNKTDLPVIAISGTFSGPKMQKLNQLGINDYFRKPVYDTDKLLNKINSCLVYRSIVGGADEGLASDQVWMVGESPRIVEIMMDISNVAQLDGELLILGETGTGKEVAARIYHQISPRKNEKFVVINCANIQASLFESEIFGIEEKAATNVNFKKGKIEEAEKGVVLFDEIGDLPLEHQRKLLRLLQDKKYSRVGSNVELTLDATILTATRRNLPEFVRAGKFREDLYYRLKTNKVELPPLRDRVEDIPDLVRHFVAKYNKKYKKSVLSISEDALLKLKAWHWPGNVRQLEKCIESAVVQCKGHIIQQEDTEKYLKDEIPKEDIATVRFNKDMAYKDFKLFLKQLTDQVEREYYGYHLRANHFNKTQTADRLGIKRQFLNEITKRLEMTEADNQ